MRALPFLAILGAATGLAVAGASRAEATLLDATFSGTVVDQSGTSYAAGQTLTGSFTYDTTLGQYDSFNVGPYTLPAGATSYVPPPLTATQFAQFAAISAAPSTGNSTSTSLAVTLETNGFFNTTNLVSFVHDPGAITTNPSDPNPSTIAYAMQGASGSSTYVDADLTSFSGSTAPTGVPEPASLALLSAGIVGLAAARRRQA